MVREDLIPRIPDDEKRKHHFHAFIASCIFHGFILCLVLVLTFLYENRRIPVKNGSAPSAPSVTLSTLVIVAPPPKPPPASPVPIPPTPAPVPVAAAPRPAPPTPPDVKTPPTPSEATVPVLAAQAASSIKPDPPKITPVKKTSPSHPTPPHAVAVSHESTSRPVAAAAPSSYAPGASDLPHPPYPSEARDHHQTGTVIMSVEFDSQGRVAEAEVAQSSGVSILDSSTKSFIRAHWHSPTYAGQTVNVPVQYTLENL